MDNFEDIVANLDDIEYTKLEAPIITGANISVGYLLPHGPTCTCDLQLLVIKFFLVKSDPIEVAIYAKSSFGKSLLSGELCHIWKEKLDEIS